LGVDDELLRRGLRDKMEGSLRTSCDDVAQKNMMPGAVMGIERDAGNEITRNVRLEELTAD